MKLTSLTKSIQLIDLLGNHPQGLSLSDISATLGFPKSTVHHMLRTLLPYEYVYQFPETKRYGLGYKFLEISRGILNNIDVRRVAHDHLRTLQEKTKETVQLATLRGGRFIYIDKIDASDGLSLVTHIGYSTEPHAAAGGKVLLAEMRAEEILEIYPDKYLKPYGKNTISRLEDLLEELPRIRRQGYALDDEEYYEGVRCVAAPIRAGGKIEAALSVTGSIFTMTKERIQGQLIDLAKQTAAEISAELKW